MIACRPGNVNLQAIITVKCVPKCWCTVTNRSMGGRGGELQLETPGVPSQQVLHPRIFLHRVRVQFEAEAGESGDGEHAIGVKVPAADGDFINEG